MASAHSTRVVTSLTVAVENEYGNYLAGKVMDGGRLAKLAASRAIRIFRCARLRCRAASRSVWVRRSSFGSRRAASIGQRLARSRLRHEEAVRVDEAI